jgi:hypothetical protein
MNAHLSIIKAALPFAIGLSAFSAVAREAPPTNAELVTWASTQNHLVIECDQLARPALSEIIAVSGDPRFSQAREDRIRAMNRAREACNRPGVQEVWVVRELPREKVSVGPLTANANPRP